MTGPSPFEQDVASQPDGLRMLADTLGDLPRALDGLAFERYDRIVLTGMGASLYALYPAWLRLIARGFPAWWIDSAELVQEALSLVSGRTLVVCASQSGRSAEVVTLLDTLGDRAPLANLVAITNDLQSPLGKRARWVVDIAAGAEHAVGTRTYLNTLAASGAAARLLGGERTNGAIDAAVCELVDAADDLADWLAGSDDVLTALANVIASEPPPGTIIARGAALASAMEGSLVIKEAAKHPIEAMGGGQFRHGPIEIADERTSFVMLASGDAGGRSSRLASDILATGARVFWIGPRPPDGARVVSAPAFRSPFGERVSEIAPLQLLSVALARAQGFEAGHFRTATKVTVIE